LTVPRERFVSIGGFDELFQRAAAEDRDFCDRWHTLGFGMMLVPEAVVYHAHTLDFKGYWNQQFRYGMGAWRFHRARTRRHRQPVPVEPASFYLDLLRYPFRRRRLASALVLALLLALSQIANAAGFMLARYRDTDHGDSPAVSA
jgi:GT2 family glycosyltransferase